METVRCCVEVDPFHLEEDPFPFLNVMRFCSEKGYQLLVDWLRTLEKFSEKPRFTTKLRSNILKLAGCQIHLLSRNKYCFFELSVIKMMLISLLSV